MEYLSTFVFVQKNVLKSDFGIMVHINEPTQVLLDENSLVAGWRMFSGLAKRMPSQEKSAESHNDSSGHEHPYPWTNYEHSKNDTSIREHAHVWVVPILATINADHRSTWDAQPLTHVSSVWITSG